jgi:ribonucleoside-diphosphate reductase alpha chain
MRFEPSGMTNDPDIRAAKSIVDYIFRWMGKKFLSADQQEEIGILSPEVRAALQQLGRRSRVRQVRRPDEADPRLHMSVAGAGMSQIDCCGLYESSAFC